jgi:biotin synthase
MTSPWDLDSIKSIYHKPMLDLIFEAACVHKENNPPNQIQVSSLVSIKTGACPEDCSYCSQSARFKTNIKVEKLMAVEDVVEKANAAKAVGASRLCMGAAWRGVKDNNDFDQVLDMVSRVNDMGMEVCCTLGMLTEDQAKKLADAGLYAYNHNLDTSREYYDKVITTRTYDDRLDTIKHVRKAGLTVCSGGIIGLGESDDDRISMLGTLANMNPPPESVPINALVPVEGTPLGKNSSANIWDMIRMIATARILMPKTVVRLSAGRNEMSDIEQAMCFLAGANSIFAGDQLLTTPNPDVNDDAALFQLLGLRAKPREDAQPNSLFATG